MALTQQNYCPLSLFSSQFFLPPNLRHITPPHPSSPHSLYSFNFYLVTVVSQFNFNKLLFSPLSHHHVSSNLSPHSSFPLSVFFSLSYNDTGKFAPVTLRMELPKSCRWMLHGALNWCMRCKTQGGILVHGEHCGRCKAGLVLMKLMTFEAVAFIIIIIKCIYAVYTYTYTIFSLYTVQYIH